ncbi:MAG: hypothetical protein FWF92_08555 [Oscillospiraceae bacterium]|nr:hypothetical protein [Oscillospiraceae bacterium]
MSKITITDIEYKNYGKCKVISNGLFEMYVTVDIGPRIIKVNLTGKENLMFNDIDRAMCEDVSSVFGEGKNWYIYGGHRLWVSPEDMPKTYYPDNEPVGFKINANKILFTPPPQKVSDLQHSIEIEIYEDKACAKITHKIVNIGKKEVTGAIWALSVMAPGGTVICPQPDEDTGVLGNRCIALWPYTRLTDSRANFFDKYITVKQNKNINEKFKFGINNTKGWLAYQNHGQILKKSYNPNHPDGIYPDWGMSTEIFTNHLFAEAETLSELKTLRHGEFIEHTEIWELIDASVDTDVDFKCGEQDKIDDYVRKYII